jgi:hypothetical protein
MAQWSEFASSSPHLAAVVHDLLHQYGPGLGYLATVRADGGPRVHPVSPVVHGDKLYCFIVASPKRADLERDGRYALHSFPPEEHDDEAYVAGQARPVTDQARVARLAESLRAAPRVDWRLFEFTVDVAMLARRGQSLVADGGEWSRPAVQVWLDPHAPGRVAGGGPDQVGATAARAPEGPTSTMGVPVTRAGNRRGRHARRPVTAGEKAVPAP